MEGKDLGKTSIGMQANLAALLTYALGFITGIVFYIIEKKNKFVRFHAMQSIIVFGGFAIIAFILSVIIRLLAMIKFYFFIPLFSLIGTALWLAALIIWIILMLKAYNGEKFKLPVIGDIAEKNS